MTVKLWQPYPAREIWHTPSIAGTLLTWADFYSPQLENHRDIHVHLPPSYADESRRYPVIYMQDGQNLFDSGTSYGGSEWGVDETMEMLSGEGIEAIVVGLNHTNEGRISEYNPYPQQWQGAAANTSGSSWKRLSRSSTPISARCRSANTLASSAHRWAG